MNVFHHKWLSTCVDPLSNPAFYELLTQPEIALEPAEAIPPIDTATPTCESYGCKKAKTAKHTSK